MKKITIIITLFLFINSNLAVQGLNIQKSTIQQVNTSQNYDMVIIAPEHFSNSLLPLIDHKNSVGVETFVKTTEEIYEEYIGRDEAEQIKYCILDFIETYNIQYVLLIGDIETLPIRKTEVNHIWPSNDLIQIDDIITDLYYADIYDEFGNFSSWDSNNDGIFSEYYLYNLGENPDDVVIVDEVDLYPDIGVGRIPCKTIDELSIVVNKIIAYETQSFGNWFDRLLLASVDGFPESGSQCEIITDLVAEIMSDFTPVKLYESLGNLKVRLINKEINTGVGLFLFLAHGRDMAIDKYHKIFIKGLLNEDKLPVIFLGGCYNGQLDASLHFLLQELGLIRLDNFLQLLGINTEKLRSCIAWEFLKHNNGGSIATFAATRSGTIIRDDPPSAFSGFLILKFFEAYEPGITLSDMYNRALAAFINESWKNYVALQMIITLGDPSLKIGGYQ